MIKLDNVLKKFGDKIVIDRISMTIERGTSCGYIGPNGAGKTTTARLITGLILPDEGDVTFLD
jgi:ABC-type uncharacterized transport system, ATPase component